MCPENGDFGTRVAFLVRPGGRSRLSADVIRLRATAATALLLFAIPSHAAQAGSGPPSCGVAALHVRAEGGVSEQTGQNTGVVVMTNRLGRACVIEGYPTILLFDDAGRELLFVYRHGGDQMITNRPPARVFVPASGSAFFAFNKYRCDIHEIAVARTLQLALPGSAKTLAVLLPPYPRISYCPADVPASRTIAVSPISRTRASTFAHG
jgi:uncharacterized protein DUF4232